MSLTASLSFNAASSLKTHTSSGWNSLICSSNFVIFEPAAMATTFKSSFALTISNVCVPMDPVDPRMEIFFISSP